VTTLSLLFVVLLGAIVVLASLKPDAFRVTRVAHMEAPAEAVFARLVDLRQWQAWSPWAKRDPNAKNVYDGPESGVGSSLAWDGNAKVGAGKMTITECVRDESLRLKLEFLRPMQATNQASFELKPEGTGASVTWSMAGKRNFFAKLFLLVMDVDKMIGKDFEEGLANLKVLVEDAAQA
jgi:hypothetical protein